MNAKSLRELQQKGGKAIGNEPVVVTSRKGPVGVLIPVTSESLPRIQQEVQRMLALESLSETWKLAREAGLDRMTDEEINAEVRAVRKNTHAQPKRRH
jgi:antitoxin (DNA-binding transcriptional repressor) of toxin-antitoxin stability system